MKERTIRLTLMLITLAVLALVGCGQSTSLKNAVETNSTEVNSIVEANAESSTSIEETRSSLDLPEGVEQVMAEKEPNPELARAIINYYHIPEDGWEQSKYYYNYVDLNGDGTDEIITVVMGPYNSGTGGDSALWVIPYAKMAVSQAFTLVNTPIIITKKATNGLEFGAKGLIINRSGGGGTSEYVMLINTDGEYNSVSDAFPVEDFESVEGMAIICNDLLADAQTGSFHTLLDAK